MKTRLHLPAVCLVVSTAFLTAQEDWKAEARAFAVAQGIPLLEARPGTRSATDVARERWAWMQRVFWPVFEKHAQKWPEHAERMRRLVRQALLARIGHPEVDRARTPEWLEKEGLELEKAGIDEPLVRFATAWAAWEWREGYNDARDRLRGAERSKLLKDYPAAARLLIRHLLYEAEEARRRNDDGDKEEFFKAAMAAAKDPSSYSADEDEIEWADTYRLFYQQYFDKHTKDMEKLVNEDGESPWLREMRRGFFEFNLGWKRRGVKNGAEEGWKGYADLMQMAAGRYRAAWELKPRSPHAPCRLIEVLMEGFHEPGETIIQWFERAVDAQFDSTLAYQSLVWSVRPRRGGTVDKVKAVLLALALVDRPDTGLSDLALKLVDDIRGDSHAVDDRVVLKDPLIRAAVLHTARRLAEEPSRVWEKPWRQGDLAVYAWKAGEYSMADELLRGVPSPFPRQTRRKLHLQGNEASVRGESLLHAAGMSADWDKAVDLYTRRDIFRAMELGQELANQFPIGAPPMVLGFIATCDFELRFNRGDWVVLEALPEMAAWHHLSGSWSGAPDGTLSIQGNDAQGYILLNGRVGRDFEMRGEYTVEGWRDGRQGLTVITGYHRDPRERWVGCSQWASEGVAVATALRDFVQSRAAPRVLLRADERVWRFHIVCKDGRLHYRLNHHDVLVDHLNVSSGGTAFEMTSDARIGFCSHFFKEGTTTSIRRLQIRRLPQEEKPPSKHLDGLHAMMRLEIQDRAEEARRDGRAAEAEKIEAFGAQVGRAGSKPVPLPVVTLAERHLHALLRGYRHSAALRAPASAAPMLQEALPLAEENQIHWEIERGSWSIQEGVLHGSGDSIINYDFGHAPPFQIEFDLTVREGMRPRLVMGRVKFANEGFKTTFGLYPQPKGQPLFNYERGRSYHIAVKAFPDKTELHVDGVKACDGPKIDGKVDLLQFRAGDDYSKGRAEFRGIRVSPLR